LIILIMLGEKYKSRSSLRIFLHPSTTSSIFGPNILLSTMSQYSMIFNFKLVWVCWRGEEFLILVQLVVATPTHKIR
jgi:hypothetical protein